MMTKRHGLLAGAFVLTCVGAVAASYQASERICWLGTGNFQLREHGGMPCLVEGPYQSENTRLYKWHISVPTIKNDDGKYLASDPAGKEATLHFVSERGPNTDWSVQFLGSLTPGRSPAMGFMKEGLFREGPSGYTFVVKQARGPYKDWYLAADKTKQTKEGPQRRALRLVRDAKEATVFSYVEIHHYVGHK